jgi:integrase
MLTGKTKAGAMYNVPMTQRLYERLLFVCSSARGADESLFAIFENEGTRKSLVNYGTMYYWLQDAKAKAGVTNPWSFHDLRRTAARALYERTHDIRKVQRLLSHSNLQHSFWYIGALGVDLEAADLEPQPTKEVQCVHQPDPSSDKSPNPTPTPEESSRLEARQRAPEQKRTA